MIVPALLTDKKQELESMISLCGGFTDFVQIDIMDGVFVPSLSLGLGELESLRPDLRCEAHLMVADPRKWLGVFKKMGAERIIYHFEISQDHLSLISQIKSMGFKAGIALNPQTNISEIEYLINQLDTVLFMSVNPGYYGAEFIPGVLDKISGFKKLYPGMETGIDGGIKSDNVFLAHKAGADYICVGSAILKSENPAHAYGNLLKKIQENA